MYLLSHGVYLKDIQHRLFFIFSRTRFRNCWFTFYVDVMGLRVIYRRYGAHVLYERHGIPFYI